MSIRVGTVLAQALLLCACTYSSTYGPHSEPAELGVPVEWIVASDCGLDNMVFDIDGSLWVPIITSTEDRDGTPQGFAADNDTGTLTLVSEDEAEYDSSLGRVVPLSRLSGDFVSEGC